MPVLAFQNIFVEVNIDHPNRSDLVIEFGIGDPSAPDFVTILQQNQTNPSGFPAETNVDQIYDGDFSDDSLFPPMPSGNNLYWLRVTDTKAGNFGALKKWCIARQHNPAATDLNCEFNPVDLNTPLDITDGQSTISYLGVEASQVGQSNHPDQTSCSGIYGVFTTNALFNGDQTGFYIQAQGSSLSGIFASNVVFGNKAISAEIVGRITSTGQCQLAILFEGSQISDSCPFAISATLEDFESNGLTYGHFTIGGGMLCEEVFQQLEFDFLKVSG